MLKKGEWMDYWMREKQTEMLTTTGLFFSPIQNSKLLQGNIIQIKSQKELVFKGLVVYTTKHE